ncbi:MAG: S8 family serine peptidase [Verrucomicrobiota bacterium]
MKAKFAMCRSALRLAIIVSMLWAIFSSEDVFAQVSYELNGNQIDLCPGHAVVGFDIATDEYVRTEADGTIHYETGVNFTSAAELLAQLDIWNMTLPDTYSAVVYQTGLARIPDNRGILMHMMRVELVDPAEAAVVAERWGLEFQRGSADPSLIYQAFIIPKTMSLLSICQSVQNDPEVVQADLQVGVRPVARFVPNDALYSDQWHHQASGLAPNFGTGIEQAWDVVQGNGMTIAIVDSGCELGHPDLSFATNGLNVATNAPNGGPTATQFHGTAVGGCAAAIGNNGIGVAGSAFASDIIPINIFNGALPDPEIAQAMLHAVGAVDVSNNSWGFTAPFSTTPGPLTEAAFETGAMDNDVIYCFSAGNDRSDFRRAEHSRLAGSPYTISVAAAGHDGQVATYSSWGAANVISAPSQTQTGASVGNLANRAIATVDRTGANGYNSGTFNGWLPNFTQQEYTRTFNGTSAASPIAAGICALVQEAYMAANGGAKLGFRDMQEILIATATQIDPTDPSWFTNRAGQHFSEKYGAGLINANAAVTAALTYGPRLENQGQYMDEEVSGVLAGVPIVSGGAAVTDLFDFQGQGIRVEHVIVDLDINHPVVGDLEITITSPQGNSATQTVSRINEAVPAGQLATFSAMNRPFPTGWEFMSVQFWGEGADGVWSVTVQDTVNTPGGGIIANRTGNGTYNGATLRILGTPGTGGNSPPTITNAFLTPNPRALDDEDIGLPASNITASDPDGDQIGFSYLWEESANGEDFYFIYPDGDTFYDTLPASVTKPGYAYRGCVRAHDQTDGFSDPIFHTDYTFCDSQPIETATVGVEYCFDVDLFVERPHSAAGDNRVVFNEFCQGQTGDQEWFELLVTQDVDMRGWTLHDSYLFWDVRFNQHPMWANVPKGALILVYNGEQPDPQLPADDYSFTDGSNVVVIGSTNTTYFDVPSSGTGWGEIIDNIPQHASLRDANMHIVDAFSINGDTTFPPTMAAPHIGELPSRSSMACNGSAIGDYDSPGQWVVGAWNAVTPGAANTAANTTFIQNVTNGTEVVPLNDAMYSFGGGTDAIPGLNQGTDIDPITGVIKFTPTTAGVYTVVVNRSAPWGSNSPPYTYELTVTAPAPSPPPATSDEDGDGANYLLERAFNLDVNNPDVGWQPGAQTHGEEGEGGEMEDYLSVTFTQLKGGVFDPGTLDYVIPHPDYPGLKEIVYRVECSTDLATWHSGPSVVSRILVVDDPSDPASAERATFRTASGVGDETCQFLRVVVEERDVSAP